jgi:hypothetical protein
MNNILKYEILPDEEYTLQINDKVAASFPSNSNIRNATHLSDLYTCLLKAWGKRQIPEAEWVGHGEDEDGDPLLQWNQGLQFEALVSEGSKQRVAAYCFKCRAVSYPIRNTDGSEQAECPVCNNRWLHGTPDYEVDGIIHEAKQTRKSQRAGPANAEWWIEQLAGYLLYQRKAQQGQSWGRLVVNWLMGDYGSRKKGVRPRPPRSSINAYRIDFSAMTDENWNEWEGELLRRQQVVDGPDRPELSFPGSDSIDSPRYGWECPSCPVGKPLECTNWVWNDDDTEKSSEKEVVDNVAIQE